MKGFPAFCFWTLFLTMIVSAICIIFGIYTHSIGFILGGGIDLLGSVFGVVVIFQCERR